MKLNIELTSVEKEVLEIALSNFKIDVTYLYENVKNEGNEEYYKAVNSLMSKI